MILIQVPVSYLRIVREVWNSLDLFIYSWLRPAAQHAYHRLVKLINESFEVVFSRVTLQKRSSCCDWLGPSICVHLLHGETKFFGLKVNEHVCQYGRISEHALCGKIHELFVNIIDQEGAVVELRCGLFIV